MHDNPEVLRHSRPRWLRPAGLAGLGLVVVVALGGGMTRVFASQGLKHWTQEQAVPTVDIIAPSSAAGNESLVLPGDVQAYYTAVVRARVSGYLKSWRVDIGAHVRAGQVLADIETPELDQQLAQAKANLATAEANQKLSQVTAARWKSLLEQDAVSRQEADEKAGDLSAKTSLMHAAQAEVDRLQALESFKRIVAPFDGVATARNTDVGALIAAGNPNDPGLFTVADVRKLRIYVHVPQSYTAQIKPGATVTLTVPEYPGRNFQATLVSTSEAVSTQTGALLAEAQIDNRDGQLKPGDYAQVKFDLPASSDVLHIPASALMFLKDGMAVATVAPNGHIAMKHINVLRDLGASVEIAPGAIAASDRVVDNPPDSLANGDLVRVTGASAARFALATRAAGNAHAQN